MANTTNFGWETPDDTDLVKDGAAAIRTLAGAIDTSLVDLKGGTTDQVLAKNSGTDMDFKWVADASGIPATIFDAKGDIIAASAADTAARLAVGANNTVLTADSSTATGLKWVAPAGGGKVLQVVQATSTTSTNVTSTSTYGDLGLSVSITPSSATSKVLVLISQSLYSYRGSNNTGYAIRLVRDSTAVWTPSVGNYQSGYVFLSGAASGGESAQMYNTFNLHYLDSPATTSATTYKTQGLCSGGNVNAQEGSNGSTIIVMEISA